MDVDADQQRPGPRIMAEDVSEENLTTGLSLLVKVGNALLETAKQEAEASLETFVPRRITTLYGLLTAGADLYKRLGVKKKSEAEALWQKSEHHDAVREQVEELLQLEVCLFKHLVIALTFLVRFVERSVFVLQRRWDSFLEAVGTRLQTEDGGAATGSLSPDAVLTEALSGRAVTLGRYLGQGHRLLLVLIRHFGCLACRDHVAELLNSQADLEARSMRVLVVSFGSREGAQMWLEQTGCSFEMVLDPQRQIYRTLGLSSSFTKVMKFSCLLQYSEYGAVDRDFPDVPSRLLEDIYQLGGDFLLDDTGKVLLSHASDHPLDRPTVAHILEAVEAVEAEGRSTSPA
ncbi:selenoprotein L isoform X1 [Betta splendens]|uniref:Selenoprotein L isoform X1 n=1 Tax=Betta splendens TaxID=158456 RepID=A0A6P7LTW1_BETSP|nr:selenoprotein L isoform X1 [Betta splendens]